MRLAVASDKARQPRDGDGCAATPPVVVGERKLERDEPILDRLLLAREAQRMRPHGPQRRERAQRERAGDRRRLQRDPFAR